jgi:hypothetical protein
MSIGLLEYAVIGIEDDQFTHAILPEVSTLDATKNLRMLEILLVQKHADGTVITQKTREVGAADLPRDAGLADNRTGMLTEELVAQRATVIPPGTSAVIVLFEHTLALGLTAIRTPGGVYLAGGLVTPNLLDHGSTKPAALTERYA